MNSYLETLKRFGVTTITGVRGAIDDDRQDAALMLELARGSAEIGRATLAPVTLATIGLDSGSMRTIARELAADHLERLAMAHKVLCAFKTRASDVEHIDYCAHGLDSDTECENCSQDRAEHSQVPTDWFAGGFADNH